MRNEDELVQPQAWVDNLFDDVFYINLARSKDRRKQIEAQFKDSKTNVQRIPATDFSLSNELAISKIDNNLEKISNKPYQILRKDKQRITEVAVAESHSRSIIAAISNFRRCNQPTYRALILEDDANLLPISSDFFKSLQKTLNNSDSYDICQLGYTIFPGDISSWMLDREYCIDTVAINTEFAECRHGVFGMIGYVVNINRENVSSLLRFAEELYKGNIADYLLAEASYLRKIAPINFKPIVPSNAASTIAQDQTYDAVQLGYEQFLGEHGLVKGHSNYDTQHWLRNKELDTHKDAWYLCFNYKTKPFIASKVDKHHRFTVEYLVKFYQDRLEYLNVYSAYIVIFNNPDYPNLGTKVYIKNQNII